jgi:hypothetical protein
MGFLDNDTCTSSTKFFANRLTPTGSCNRPIFGSEEAIPASALWDPATNLDGVKCIAFQQMANQLGIDPASGFPNSPLDSARFRASCWLRQPSSIASKTRSSGRSSGTPSVRCSRATPGAAPSLLANSSRSVDRIQRENLASNAKPGEERQASHPMG